MILDIPPQIEQVLIDAARARGQSVQDFILMSAYEKALQPSPQPNPQSSRSLSVVDYLAKLPPLDLLSDVDPLDYQKAVRDE